MAIATQVARGLYPQLSQRWITNGYRSAGLIQWQYATPLSGKPRVSFVCGKTPGRGQMVAPFAYGKLAHQNRQHAARFAGGLIDFRFRGDRTHDPLTPVDHTPTRSILPLVAAFLNWHRHRRCSRFKFSPPMRCTVAIPRSSCAAATPAATLAQRPTAAGPSTTQ